ncbi:MAG: hypothetical protein M1821_009724 [Bathelium mastoideum]|nr:MAG: hypothetical protein M1821_009724 [Bathelium mastoideum]
MSFSILSLTTLALAALTQCRPLDTNTTSNGALEARQIVPIGIHLWGGDHSDCQNDASAAPQIMLQYNEPATVGKSFTTFALSRALAENEHIEFYTAAKNSWNGEPEGDWCAVSVGTADWTVHADQCGQVNEDVETGDLAEANCIKLVI